MDKKVIVFDLETTGFSPAPSGLPTGRSRPVPIPLGGREPGVDELGDRVLHGEMNLLDPRRVP